MIKFSLKIFTFLMILSLISIFSLKNYQNYQLYKVQKEKLSSLVLILSDIHRIQKNVILNSFNHKIEFQNNKAIISFDSIINIQSNIKSFRYITYNLLILNKNDLIYKEIQNINNIEDEDLIFCSHNFIVNDYQIKSHNFTVEIQILNIKDENKNIIYDIDMLNELTIIILNEYKKLENIKGLNLFKIINPI